jgi:hypothetical protein
MRPTPSSTEPDRKFRPTDMPTGLLATLVTVWGKNKSAPDEVADLQHARATGGRGF